MTIEISNLLNKIPRINNYLNKPVDEGRRKFLKDAGLMAAAVALAACTEIDPNQFKEFIAGDFLFSPIEYEKIVKQMDAVNLPLFDEVGFTFASYPLYETWNKISGIGNVIELMDLDRKYIENQRSYVAVLPYTKDKYYFLSGGHSTKDYTGINIRYVDRTTDLKVLEGTVKLDDTQMLMVNNVTTGGRFALQATVKSFEYLTNQPVTWRMYKPEN